MTVDIRWHGRTAVLAASGEVDMVTAPRLEETLSSAVDEQPETLVVDLSQVEFFASAGLSALVSASQRAGEHSELRVVATDSTTARPLRVTALDRRIPVYDSLERALDGS